MKRRDIMGHKVGMTSYVQIWGACTPEILEGQKVKNSTRYRTTFDYDREYLRNRLRYQKSETNLINNDPHWVQQKNW